MVQAAALQRQPTSAAAGKFKVAVLGAGQRLPQHAAALISTLQDAGHRKVSSCQY
jgi:hypothetical protein